MATDPRAPLITRIPPKPTHFAYRTGTRASDIPLLTAGTTTGVTINELAPTTRRIIQTDDGQVYATVSFSGGYSGGTPASMQVRLNYKGGGAFQANTTLSGFSAGGGAWSGTMPVPAGSWLLAIAQDPTSGQTSSAQTIWWGVGDRFDVTGQSNALKWFAAYFRGGGASVPVDDHSAVAPQVSTATDGWELPNQVSIAQGGGYDNDAPNAFSLLFRAAYIALNGAGDTRPCGFGAAASGGVPLNPNWLPGGVNWTGYVNVTNLSDIGAQCKLWIWAQGEAETAAFQANAVNYYTDLGSLITNVKARVNRSDFKFGIIGLGSEVDPGNTNDTATNLVRLAQWNRAHEAGNLYLGTTYDIGIDTNYHHIDYFYWWSNRASLGGGQQNYTQSDLDGYWRLAKRAANAYLYSIGLSPYGSDGPQITSGSLVGNVVTARCTQWSGGTRLQMGDGSTGGTNLPSLNVQVNGSVVPITSTAFSGNNIIINLSSTPPAGSSVTVHYGEGANPFNFTAGNSFVNVICDDNVYGGAGALATILNAEGTPGHGDGMGLPLVSTFGAGVLVSTPGIPVGAMSC